MTTTETTLDVTMKIRRTADEEFKEFESEAIREAIANLFGQIASELKRKNVTLSAGAEMQFDGTMANIIRNPQPPPPPPCKFNFKLRFNSK